MMTKLAAAEVAALDPYKFMATIGKRPRRWQRGWNWPDGWHQAASDSTRTRRTGTAEQRRVPVMTRHTWSVVG